MAEEKSVTSPPQQQQQRDDEALMREAIALAQTAREGGNHPFGALLVDARTGQVLLRAMNSVGDSGGDITRHAELNLISAASTQLSPDVLQVKPSSVDCNTSPPPLPNVGWPVGAMQNSVLYTSTEPCAMCTGAIAWSGVPTVCYGKQEERGIEVERTCN